MGEDHLLKVIAGHPDHPLVIGDIHIPCYVLENESRVLTQRGLFFAVNSRIGPSGREILNFIDRNWIIPFISNTLSLGVKSPIPFLWKTKRMLGYPSELLPDLCASIINAHVAGATTTRQASIVRRAYTLQASFAKVGIVALIDEATGYQTIRDREALHKLLDRFLREEHAKWAKRFPDEFYIQMFRLKNWPWRGMKINRPQVVGIYTNQIVWDRLAPGLRKELERRNPPNENGERPFRHHQFLTEDIGHPALQEHLHGVIAIMRAAQSWAHFQDLLTTAYPKRHENKILPYDQ